MSYEPLLLAITARVAKSRKNPVAKFCQEFAVATTIPRAKPRKAVIIVLFTSASKERNANR